jgi:DNA-binding NtrC family response regulator
MRSVAIRLSFVDSEHAPVCLGGARIRVGSGAGNELVLRGLRIRPIHALFVRSGDGFEILDYSGEGVELNGRRVFRAALQGGDFLRIGGQFLRLELIPGGGRQALTDQEPTGLCAAAPELAPPAIAAMLRARIRGVWRTLPLRGRAVFLGKSYDNDLVLDDPTVSRWHCRISPTPAGHEVEDLGSTNGTLVNGARVERAALCLGSELRLGRAVVHYLASTCEGTGDNLSSYAGLVGASPAMAEVFRAIARYAGESDPVLLFGETGTGKELVARALHTTGPRKDRPFVALNCGALPRDLVESELFGHERGAFSGALTQRRGLFEEAEGGTLFLDELAELAPEMQAKLLRALESGEVRRVGANQARRIETRVVAAVNRPVCELVDRGRLRRDLYHRLSVVEIRLPPLRERLEDIPLLARHFLEAGTGKTLSAAALVRLQEHCWPGNVRELRNVLRRASLRTEGSVIEPAHLEIENACAAEAKGGTSAPGNLAEIERKAILLALRRHRGNKSAACRELGIARSTFFEKLRRYGVGAPADGESER